MKPEICKIYNENNLFQHIEVIKRNRKKRVEHHEFFVEGVLSIKFAIDNNWEVKTLAYSREKPLSNWAQNIIANSKAQTHIEMPLAFMEKLSDKDEDISEIIAIVSIPKPDLSIIPIKDDMLVLVFDRPSSHGNLGTLIRSCEALKVDGLIITGHAVDLYDPKTIRSSMGAFFMVPTLRMPSQNELVSWIDKLKNKYSNLKIIGSSAKGEALIEEADLTGPTILLIGNETNGLSSNYKNMCDQLVRIPMYGRSTSFNVSCAASIMLYEIDRQRRNSKGKA